MPKTATIFCRAGHTVYKSKIYYIKVGQYDKVVSQMRQQTGPKADMSTVVDIIFAHKQYRYKKNSYQLFLNVYFSLCFFSKQTINTYLKLEIRVAYREFLDFKYVVIVFSKQNR
jgi:hypothetical protein